MPNAECRISNVEKGPAKSINNGQLAINNFECNVEFPRSIEMQEYLESSKNLDIRHSALYIRHFAGYAQYKPSNAEKNVDLKRLIYVCLHERGGFQDLQRFLRIDHSYKNQHDHDGDEYPIPFDASC
jgi:hypothetical protein